MSDSLNRSNSLAVLAARIRDEHEATAIALKRGIEHAFTAGELLIEAKAQVPHGQWLPWLRDHCQVSERMAQRYIRLAQHREVIEANTTPLSDLTLNGALALLTIPGTAEKVIAATEASEAVADKAEAARRQVMFDAIKCNNDAVVALKEKYIPADFYPSNPPEWLEKLFDELLETVADMGNKYDHAVECGDHTRAFELVSWAHDLSVDMRWDAEDICAAARKRGAVP
jgi:Protein of unknown function (DUF3102)